MLRYGTGEEKTRTEQEYKQLTIKATFIITGLVCINIILLFLVLLAYMPLPIPR